jgi:hypothetical protein
MGSVAGAVRWAPRGRWVALAGADGERWRAGRTATLPPRRAQVQLRLPATKTGQSTRLKRSKASCFRLAVESGQTLGRSGEFGEFLSGWTWVEISFNRLLRGGSLGRGSLRHENS